MPTTPIDSAIGRRMNASTIISSRPTRHSVIALARRLAGARLAGDEDLEDVHGAGEADHQRHEIDERADVDAEDIGRVAVAGDARRLDPHLPGEEEHDRG